MVTETLLVLGPSIVKGTKTSPLQGRFAQSWKCAELTPGSQVEREGAGKEGGSEEGKGGIQVAVGTA